MDICDFAVFKYKKIEGVLKYWRASEFEISKYKNDKGLSAYICYDIKNDKADLFVEDLLITTCAIKDLPEVLKDNNLYELE